MVPPHWHYPCNAPAVVLLNLIPIVAGRRRAPRLHWRGGGGGGEEDQKVLHRAPQLPDQLPQLPNRTTQHSDDTSQTPDPSSLRTRRSSNLGSNPTLPMINLPRLPKLSGFSLPHLSHSQPWLAALVLVILLVPTGQYHTYLMPRPFVFVKPCPIRPSSILNLKRVN